MEVVVKFLFVAFFFGLMMSITALPYPYSFVVLGAMILGCLYWIYRIVINTKLTSSEKWDRLLGRTL